MRSLSAYTSIGATNIIRENDLKKIQYNEMDIISNHG